MSGMTSPAPSAPRPPHDAIAISGRWAFLSLLGGASFWLVISALLGLIASINLHAPTLLANCSWMSYGKLKAASAGAFNFGFTTPAAVAVTLWLVATLGKTTVRLPFISVVSGKIWNLGVLLGVFGVLYGDGTGHAMLEFPRYSLGLLLVAYIGLAVPVFVTFHNRSVRELYPSFWFVIASLFWFAWLFSTAVFLLQISPVRGILQTAVEGWFANGFVVLWLLPVAIAVLLYLRPLMSGTSISSRATVQLGFWTLAFIGPWGGIAVGTPLPAWVGGVSSGMSGLFLVSVLAIFQCLSGMKRGANLDPYGAISWGMLTYSFFAFLLFGVLTAANSFSQIYNVTEFTFVSPALRDLALYGVVSTALFAGVYQFLPKLVEPCDLSRRTAGWHSIAIRVGTGFLVLPLLLAGLGQGWKLADGKLPFAASTQAAKFWLHLSALGDVLLLLAALIFFGYVMVTFARAVWAEYLACAWCGPAARTAEVAP